MRPIDHAAIIEKHFRSAVGDFTSPMMIELDAEAEEIHVWYRCAMYICDCDSDDAFIFTSPAGTVVFNIPPEYFSESD